MQTRQCRMTCKLGIIDIFGCQSNRSSYFFRAQMGRFISNFMVLYFWNVDLDIPKILVLFWTPVLSRYGEENLTSQKKHHFLVVHLWPTGFVRANYVQPVQQNFSRAPMQAATQQVGEDRGVWDSRLPYIYFRFSPPPPLLFYFYCKMLRNIAKFFYFSPGSHHFGNPTFHPFSSRFSHPPAPYSPGHPLTCPPPPATRELKSDSPGSISGIWGQPAHLYRHS